MKTLIPSIAVPLLLGTIVGPPASAFGADPTTAVATRTVAVLPFAAVGQDSTSGIVLSDAIAMEILRTRKARVLERSQVKAILEEQGLQSSGACDAQECAVEVGRMLGVGSIVVGTVGRLGNANTLSLRLVDVQSSEIVAFASERTEGPLQNLLGKPLEHAVASLLPKPEEPSPVAASSARPLAPDTALPPESGPEFGKPVIPRSIWGRMAPGSVEVGADATIAGRGAREYQAAGGGGRLRAWWNVPNASWVQFGPAAWLEAGLVRNTSPRIPTTGFGVSLSLRGNVGLLPELDLLGQLETNPGYFVLAPDSEHGGAGSRWEWIHLAAAGLRWHSPWKGLDLAATYGYGFLVPDPLHRIELSAIHALP